MARIKNIRVISEIRGQKVSPSNQRAHVSERISSGTAGLWHPTCQPRRLTAVAWSVWLGSAVWIFSSAEYSKQDDPQYQSHTGDRKHFEKRWLSASQTKDEPDNRRGPRSTPFDGGMWDEWCEEQSDGKCCEKGSNRRAFKSPRPPPRVGNRGDTDGNPNPRCENGINHRQCRLTNQLRHSRPRASHLPTGAFNGCCLECLVRR